MTASWLRQMGWNDVFVLAEAGRETGWPPAAILGPAPLEELHIDCAGLAALIARSDATVVDLSLSRDYRKAHIPGAWFAIRSRLASALANIPLRGALVLTSEDGVLAGLAAPEARALVDRPVRWLDGGNAAWQAAGHSLTAADARMADEPVDMWLKPYERPNDTTKAMNDYLTWEVDLLARIERDGSTHFMQPRS
jgi:rhodanese-related sulfurtransferase